MPGTWQSRWRQRVKANAGAPFEPEAVAALAMIQEHDAPSWARVRKALRDTGVSLRELDRALQAKRPRGAPADAEPEENVPADDGDADGGDATPGAVATTGMSPMRTSRGTRRAGSMQSGRAEPTSSGTTSRATSR